MKTKQTNSKYGKTRQHCAVKKARHWHNVALLWKQWVQLGSPLRPSAQDLSFFTDAINYWVRKKVVCRALILGVTPELYNLPWPQRTEVLVADFSANMINHVWPGPRNSAICAEWTNLPLENNSCDIVLCDGGLNLLSYPDGQCKLIRTLQRIVVPGGLCIFRLFVPPRKSETVEEVLQDMLDAKIPKVNVLKLRLWMALQKDVAQGVQMKKVWDEVFRVAPDFDRLALKTGWPIEHLLTINSFKDNPARNYFLNTDEVQNLFCKMPGGFEFLAVHVPEYERGECCPTVVFRRAAIK